MEIFIPLLAIAALIWFFIRAFKPDAPKQTQYQHTEAPQRDPMKEASKALQQCLGLCQDQHPEAVNALLWIAATDGTVSKQEARNVFRFCEMQGTPVTDAVYDALEYLNSGMRFTTSRSGDDVKKDFSILREKPVAYRAAFIGAAHAICGNAKKMSKTKREFLTRAEGLVTE